MKWHAIALVILLLTSGVIAQYDSTADEFTDDATAEPEADWIVEVEAADGLILVGDFINLGESRPTVLLLHQLYTTRTSWSPLVWPLAEAGFNVLVVDLRGFGDTRGAIDWMKAVEDVQVWLDWLREQPGVHPDMISTLGSSMGSSLALVGCANDARCRTAIALSPGWDYYRVETAGAFGEDFGERPVLLVYSERDRWPSLGIPRILETATNPVELLAYPGNDHGMTLFDTYEDTLILRIIDWLNQYGR